MPLGAHLPVGKGLVVALEEAQALGLDGLQIFSKSPRQGNAAPLDAQKVALLRRRWGESGYCTLVARES